MKFKNIFDHPPRRSTPADAGDFRTGASYLFTPDMELAISAANVTQRPLLVTGPAGCGKSSLARSAAARLNWRYLDRTVNSRTEITSLLWELDHLKRLQDAQAQCLDSRILAYVRPAVLWQALDAASAADPLSLLNPTATAEKFEPAVVLIDEIDKADPDLPNNLLEVLGGLRFEVADSGQRVTSRSGVPLIIITSNDERDLPPAFVRRCISLQLKQPDLSGIGDLHFPGEEELVEAALQLFDDSAREGGPVFGSASAAEFLDFLQACKQLHVSHGTDAWLKLAEACVLKGRNSAGFALRGV